MAKQVEVPICRETLRELVGRFPRADLGRFPTPLDEAPRFSRALGGPRVFIKREDLTGLAFGGNKTRHLEFMLASAVENGADVVVTGSAAQSNFCRQTTAACANLGLDIHLVLRKVRGEVDETRQGNLLLDHLMGASISLVGPDEGERQTQMKTELVAQLKREGRNPYVPYQSDSHLAVISYAECLVEILDQLQELGAEAQYLYVGSGSFTLAGLILGSRCLGLDLEARGFSPSPIAGHARARVARMVGEGAKAMGLSISVGADEICIGDDYVGEGYGVPTEEGVAALKLLARTEGILLDPVYTSKAMAALVDHATAGQLTHKDTVVFVHTGGTPAVFAYAETLV